MPAKRLAIAISQEAWQQSGSRVENAPGDLINGNDPSEHILGTFSTREPFCCHDAWLTAITNRLAGINMEIFENHLKTRIWYFWKLYNYFCFL